jgi:hypothetical protein
MTIEIEMENKILLITATEQGFSFKNYQSFTLPGLLSLISTDFKKYFYNRLGYLSHNDPYKVLFSKNRTALSWFKSLS